ncbi:MAG: hypothetical protein KAG14_01375 [Mycoplasmataceae bacterium]|nr:hypothetical protein [Mycoplasmataceae bacterium]
MIKAISLGAFSVVQSLSPIIVHEHRKKLSTPHDITFIEEMRESTKKIISDLFKNTSVFDVRAHAIEYSKFIFGTSEYQDLLKRSISWGENPEEWRKYMIIELLKWGGALQLHVGSIRREDAQTLIRELQIMMAFRKLQTLKSATDRIQSMSHGLVDNPEYQRYRNQINALIQSHNFNLGSIDINFINQFEGLQNQFSQGNLYNLMNNIAKQLAKNGRINIDSLNHLLSIAKVINIKTMEIAQKVATWVLAAILMIIGIMLMFLFSRGIKRSKDTSKSIRILQLSLSILLMVIGIGVAISPFI